jgi:hypothetical protein
MSPFILRLSSYAYIQSVHVNLGITAICGAPIQLPTALPLQLFRFLEGALRKIKDSSAARIDPKTNPTGRKCVPPGGQSLCWRDIGSNAGFIQL